MELSNHRGSKPSAPRVFVNPPAASLLHRNSILWGKGRQYHVANFLGPLSIKTVVRGSALWTTSDAARLVDENNYLVLNSGQTYTITIDSLELVETFCLFFQLGTAEDVYRVHVADPQSLLDNPVSDRGNTGAASPQSRSAVADASVARPTSPLEFFETLHPHDSYVSPLIRRMLARTRSQTATDAWLEDQFLAIAAALSKVHRESGRRAARIPAKKCSTRAELYRRLLRGKDYMDSFSAGHLHLQEIASQACLSPYHFHRLFREVFRETPNQYLQRQRLAKAKHLLARGEQSVTNICLEVGFESITSFSGLFRRHFGCSPRDYRLQNPKAAHPH
jgi:AraC family transcriptional regulator